MSLSPSVYNTFIEILKEELVPAFGCTEPIAIAYCAAKARDLLGALPEQVVIEASGNIIKNVKSVIVPNTGGLKGIPAAAAAGIVAGNADKVLEVIAEVPDDKKQEIRTYLEHTSFTVKALEDGDKLDILITVSAGFSTAKVRIARHHSNIVLLEKDGSCLFQAQDKETACALDEADRSCLSVEAIVEFADTANLEDVTELLDRQISYNYAIAKEGLAGNWGANVGNVLLKSYGPDVRTRARAMAAAGSDARMSGCELPVVINSGSGNQGITVSVPVIVYAEELGSSRDQLYRALLISNLSLIHI